MARVAPRLNASIPTAPVPAYRSAKTALLDADWPGFHAEELSNNCRQDCRRTAGLSACDGRDGLLLLSRRPLIDNQAYLPSAFRHNFRRISDDGKTQTIKLHLAVLAMLDLENHGKVAVSVGR